MFLRDAPVCEVVLGALIFHSSPLRGLQEAVLYNINVLRVLPLGNLRRKRPPFWSGFIFLFVTECGTVNIVSSSCQCEMFPGNLQPASQDWKGRYVWGGFRCGGGLSGWGDGCSRNQGSYFCRLFRLPSLQLQNTMKLLLDHTITVAVNLCTVHVLLFIYVFMGLHRGWFSIRDVRHRSCDWRIC
jgi:hypothetical protein